MKAYIPFPELKYDREKLKELYYSVIDSPSWKQYGVNPLNSIFTHLVNVQDITSQFRPGLISNEIKFVRMLANGGAECHTDTRSVGILVPVLVEPGQLTHIHFDAEEQTQPDHLNLDGNEKVKTFQSPIKESFYLDQPMFLNTHVPHSITVKSKIDRVILTIGFNEQYDNYDLIVDMHKNNQLLI